MKKAVATLVLILFLTTVSSPSNFISQKNIKSNLSSRETELPFVEDWSSSSFETNNWTTECDNWVIDNLEGDERPSASFQWDPQLQDDYSCSLVSDIFHADTMEVGHIFFEYVFKLDNRYNTGTENLSVEVSDGSEWHQVAEYSNTNNTDWTFQHFEITDYALGNNFQVRFKATGQNSFNILSWFVDNIEIYRVCEPPDDLQGYPYFDEGPAALLTWVAPESTIVEEYNWLQWDNGTNYTGIGTTDGVDFSVAARWNAAQLSEYIGDTISSIKLFLHDDDFEQIVLKIWKGENADNLIYFDTIENPSIGVWLEYSVDTLLIIRDSTEYWAGYSVVGPGPGILVAGLDSGPAVEGYGDMIYMESTGWNALSNYGFDNNFNIKLKLMSSDIAATGCLGFNVFKMESSDSGYFYIGNTPFIDGQEQYEYIDYDVADLFTACYKVNAVWAYSYDTCISPFAITENIPFSDYVCVIFNEGINERLTSFVNLYPNPSTDKITINSEEKMIELSVMDFQGQLIINKKIDSQIQYTLNVQFLNPGLYLLKVKTKDGVGVRKFIKMD